jgi:hypothetical protein
MDSRPHARHDKATLATCEKAAEQGLPTAQIALAQLHAARRAGPKDVVHAYMWFLIAWRTDQRVQKPCQPVHDHGATARSRTTSCRVDQKDEKDSTLVDRKSSQRIYRLIWRKNFFAGQHNP